MGSYLPKPLEECDTDDLAAALHSMGCSYAGYSEAVQLRELSGEALAHLRTSSEYEQVCLSLGIKNPLHRIVLISKVKTPKCQDDDSPQALANLLQELGPDYHIRFSRAVLDNCVSMEVLGKLKLEQWKIAFDQLGMTDILEQNILFNKIMDAAAAHARQKKRKLLSSPRSQPTTSTKAIKHHPAPYRSTATRSSSRSLNDTSETMRTSWNEN